MIVTRVEVCFPTAVQETKLAVAGEGRGRGRAEEGRARARARAGAGEDRGRAGGGAVGQGGAAGRLAADNILNFLTFFTLPWVFV